MIHFTYSHLFFGIAILAVVLIFLGKQKRNRWYLFFFSIFWIYLLFVVSVIVFPVVPLSGDYAGTFKPSINLMPFYFGTCDMPGPCLRNIVENILLTIPFGFGISFIVRLKARDFFWLALLVGFVFETTQLFISLAFQSAFRAVDINDVILNAIGVWLGYFFFRMFAYLYLHITKRFGMQHRFVFAYVYDIVRQSTAH